MNKRVRLMLYDDDGNVVREVEGNGIIYYLAYEEEDEETKKTTVDSGIFGKLSPSELAVAVPSIFNMVKAAKEDKKEREE
jgi:YD repeat-containing protein